MTGWGYYEVVYYVVEQGHSVLYGKVQPPIQENIFGRFENNATQENHRSFNLSRLCFIFKYIYWIDEREEEMSVIKVASEKCLFWP